MPDDRRITEILTIFTARNSRPDSRLRNASVDVSVPVGSATDHVLEESGKVRGVFESQFVGHLGDRARGVGDALLGRVDEPQADVLLRRLPVRRLTRTPK